MFNNKKKKQTAEAEQAQRAQVDALRAQLDEVRDERAALEARIATLGETNEQLDRRLAALDHGVAGLGEQLVTLSSFNTDTNRRVHAIDERLGDADMRVDAINHRLDHVETLSTELDAINERLQSFDASTTTPPPPPPTQTAAAPPPSASAASEPPPPPPLTGAEPPNHLDEDVAELRHRLDELARQTSSIDARVISVSMELANQLTELSSDIDELNRRSTDPSGAESTTAIDVGALEARIAERLDVAMDDVLDSTERLAVEQARYEIQFRADLAELAERLRRPGTA